MRRELNALNQKIRVHMPLIGYTHQEILLRNTEGRGNIHIQSDGIEYRNRFREVWGYNCECSLLTFQV